MPITGGREGSRWRKKKAASRCVSVDFRVTSKGARPVRRPRTPAERACTPEKAGSSEAGEWVSLFLFSLHRPSRFTWWWGRLPDFFAHRLWQGGRTALSVSFLVSYSMRQLTSLLLQSVIDTSGSLSFFVRSENVPDCSAVNHSSETHDAR